MLSVSRTDNGIFAEWWWTVDRVMLFAFIMVISFGVLMAAAATPMVANRIGIEEFYFLKRHLLYIIPSILIMFFVSSLDNAGIKKMSAVIYFAALALTILTLFFGSEIKGAKRWIAVGGLSIQPSEFVKPSLAVITAWALSHQQKLPEFRGKLIATIFFLTFIGVLVLQPDFGMIVITTAVWFGQLFLNGFPIIFVIAAAVLGMFGFAMAYMFLPHVTVRVDKFLNPAIGDHYQIDKSLEAYSRGGLFGVGPGEGIVKKHLPDAHADFVFAVLGEEFGFIVCTFVVVLIAFIVIYGMLKSIKESDMFSILASVGLLAQFGLQSFINLASTLHLIPTKGMTMPFMSYGGSSMIACSILVGMILAIGRKKSNI
jgi:cell division protein FtsW